MPSSTTTPPEFQSFARALARAGLAESTCQRHVKNLRGILRRGRASGHLTDEAGPLALDARLWPHLRDVIVGEVSALTLRNYDDAMGHWLIWVADDRRVLLGRPKTRAPMDQLCADFADALESEGGQGKRNSRAARTQDTMNGPVHAWNKAVYVNRVRAFAGHECADAITREDVNRFLASLNKAARTRAAARGVPAAHKVTISSGYRNAILTAVRDYAAWRGLKDPTKKISRDAETSAVMNPRDVASPDEIRRALTEAESMMLSDDPTVRWYGARWRIVTLAGADCGLRISEALQLSGAPDKLLRAELLDGEPAWRAKLIRKWKTEETEVPITQELYRMLYAIGGPLFPLSWARAQVSGHRAYREYRAWVTGIGAPGLMRTHGLRRRSAVDKVKATGSVIYASALLDHSNVAITETYLSSMRTEREAEPTATYGGAAAVGVPDSAAALLPSATHHSHA